MDEVRYLQASRVWEAIGEYKVKLDKMNRIHGKAMLSYSIHMTPYAIQFTDEEFTVIKDYYNSRIAELTELFKSI